jgi:hypothetical protein
MVRNLNRVSFDRWIRLPLLILATIGILVLPALLGARQSSRGDGLSRTAATSPYRNSHGSSASQMIETYTIITIEPNKVAA